MRWKRRLRKTSLNRLDRTEDSLVKFYKNFKKITQLFSFKCAKFSWSRTNTTANDASNNPLSIYQLIYFRWERQCERDFAWCTRIYARITLKFNRCKVTSDLTLNLRIKKTRRWIASLPPEPLLLLWHIQSIGGLEEPRGTST